MTAILWLAMLPPIPVSLRAAGTGLTDEPAGPCCSACSLCSEAALVVLVLMDERLDADTAAATGGLLGAEAFPTVTLSTSRKLMTSTLE